GKPNCQFQVITAWLGSQIAWDGACKNGKAHGQGVLRAYKKDEKTQVFYGVLEAGQLRKGVIDSAEGGYVVGEFSNGILKPADDLKVGALTVETFTLASKIAKAYSERLKKAGNASSSEYYMQQTEKLANQMD
ncbi:MAG: hypothetical protein RL748_3169, partial [Pseudomonadota bacterium]